VASQKSLGDKTEVHKQDGRQAINLIRELFRRALLTPHFQVALRLSHPALIRCHSPEYLSALPWRVSWQLEHAPSFGESSSCQEITSIKMWANSFLLRAHLPFLRTDASVVTSQLLSKAGPVKLEDTNSGQAIFCKQWRVRLVTLLKSEERHRKP
jgi:hypothetical protein